MKYLICLMMLFLAACSQDEHAERMRKIEIAAKVDRIMATINSFCIGHADALDEVDSLKAAKCRSDYDAFEVKKKALLSKLSDSEKQKAGVYNPYLCTEALSAIATY